jgi:hypothetical protein
MATGGLTAKQRIDHVVAAMPLSSNRAPVFATLGPIASTLHTFTAVEIKSGAFSLEVTREIRCPNFVAFSAGGGAYYPENANGRETQTSAQKRRSKCTHFVIARPRQFYNGSITVATASAKFGDISWQIPTTLSRYGG